MSEEVEAALEVLEVLDLGVGGGFGEEEPTQKILLLLKPLALGLKGGCGEGKGGVRGFIWVRKN